MKTRNWMLITLLALAEPLIGMTDTGFPDTKSSGVAGHRILKTFAPIEIGVKPSGFECIFEDKDGRFWFGYPFGVVSFDEAANKWTTFSKSKGELAGYQVNAIQQSRDGGLWFASIWPLDKHVTRLDPGGWRHLDKEPKTAFLRTVTTMFAGNDGWLWLAVANKLLKYNDGQWSVALKGYDSPDVDPSGPEIYGNADPKEKVGPSQFPITAGLQDTKGRLWLGRDGSIARLEESNGAWMLHRALTIRGTVTQIYQDRAERLWFADDSAMLYVYDVASSGWTTYNLADLVLSRSGARFRRDIDGRILFTTEGIYQNKTGLMMFPTIEGLITFDDRNQKWEIFNGNNSALPSKQITSIFEDRRGRIWLSTTRGLLVLQQ